MTYTITQNCISCQRCLPACPTEAIQTNGTAFWIDVERCNHCEGSFGVAQCWAMCPTNDGCVPTAATVGLTSASEATGDYWESWFAKYTRLTARLRNSQKTLYWQQWFDTYAQMVGDLQAKGGTNAALMP
ncbi:MAG: 4Fe-4S binding protein [Cyanobacteria bacterium J06626_18]